MKKWIGPLSFAIFALMIIIPVVWGMTSAYHENHHPEKCKISKEDITKLRQRIYIIDSTKYMPTVRKIRSLSDSSIVVILSKFDNSK